MNMSVDVISIVAEYLEKNGYDGLYYPGECACLKDDLAPCGEIKHDCIAGLITGVKTDDFDFFIGPKLD